MRKTAHATVLMLALLSSVLGGACFVHWAEANPEPARDESYGIYVLSPKNTTYCTGTVDVQIKVVHYW
jgi:hypothetical protein